MERWISMPDFFVSVFSLSHALQHAPLSKLPFLGAYIILFTSSSFYFFAFLFFLLCPRLFSLPLHNISSLWGHFECLSWKIYSGFLFSIGLGITGCWRILQNRYIRLVLVFYVVSCFKMSVWLEMFWACSIFTTSRGNRDHTGLYRLGLCRVIAGVGVKSL